MERYYEVRPAPKGKGYFSVWVVPKQGEPGWYDNTWYSRLEAERLSRRLNKGEQERCEKGE